LAKYSQRHLTKPSLDNGFNPRKLTDQTDYPESDRSLILQLIRHLGNIFTHFSHEPTYHLQPTCHFKASVALFGNVGNEDKSTFSEKLAMLVRQRPDVKNYLTPQACSSK
tara:strand:+ start:1585 stop:1914 length:330 start_codon:yes stop_codon:yes gene_type:complete